MILIIRNKDNNVLNLSSCETYYDTADGNDLMVTYPGNRWFRVKRFNVASLKEVIRIMNQRNESVATVNTDWEDKKCY